MEGAPHFSPPDSTSNTRTQSRSPRRHQRIPTGHYEEFYRDVSPSKTLRAIMASSGSISSQISRDDEKLIKSIECASEAEKSFGKKVAETSKFLKAWCHELESWPWRGTFEPLAPQNTNVPESGSQNDEFVDGVFTLADEKCYGGLARTQVIACEERLGDIKHDLESLDIEEQKNHVLQSHSQTRNADTSDLSSILKYKHLDDLTALVTVTIMQGLPFYSKLLSLMSLWTARLGVLRQIPNLMTDLQLAQDTSRNAWSILLSSDSIASGFRDREVASGTNSMETVKRNIRNAQDSFSQHTTSLGQRIDAMLDALDGRSETIPEGWIDEIENLEKSYKQFVVEAERVVMRSEEAIWKPKELQTTENRAQQSETASERLISEKVDQAVESQEMASLDSNGVNQGDISITPLPYPEQPMDSINDQQLNRYIEDDAAAVLRSQLDTEPGPTLDLHQEESLTELKDLSLQAESKSILHGNAEEVMDTSGQASFPVPTGEVRRDETFKSFAFATKVISNPAIATERSDDVDFTEINDQPLLDGTRDNPHVPLLNLPSNHLEVYDAANHDERPSSFSDESIELEDYNPHVVYRSASLTSIESFSSSDVKSVEVQRSRSVPPKPKARRHRRIVSKISERSERSAHSDSNEVEHLFKRTSRGESEKRGSFASYASRRLSPLFPWRSSPSLPNESFGSGTLSASRFEKLNGPESPYLGLETFDRLLPEELAQNLDVERESQRSPLLSATNLGLLDRSDSQTVSSSPRTSDRSESVQSRQGDKLDQQIGRILTNIPLQIRFDGLSSSATRSRTYSSGSSLERFLSNERCSSTGALTPTLTLSAAQSTKDARRRRSNNDNDIKLYHLTQPGKRPAKLFVRLVGQDGERVMVRVGGGWADLGEYLREYAAHHTRPVSGEAVNFAAVAPHDPSSRVSSAPVWIPGRSETPEGVSPRGLVGVRQLSPQPPPPSSPVLQLPKRREEEASDSLGGLAGGGPRGRRTLSVEKQKWLDEMVQSAKKWKADKDAAKGTGGRVSRVGGTALEDLGKVGNTTRVAARDAEGRARWR